MSETDRERERDLDGQCERESSLFAICFAFCACGLNRKKASGVVFLLILALTCFVVISS